MYQAPTTAVKGFITCGETGVIHLAIVHRACDLPDRLSAHRVPVGRNSPNDRQKRHQGGTRTVDQRHGQDPRHCHEIEDRNQGIPQDAIESFGGNAGRFYVAGVLFYLFQVTRRIKRQEEFFPAAVDSKILASF